MEKSGEKEMVKKFFVIPEGQCSRCGEFRHPICKVCGKMKCLLDFYLNLPHRDLYEYSLTRENRDWSLCDECFSLGKTLLYIDGKNLENQWKYHIQRLVKKFVQRVN
jgi:hypothetical protein